MRRRTLRPRSISTRRSLSTIRSRSTIPATTFGLVGVAAPNTGNFFDVEAGVALILRDLNLIENTANSADDIDLQATNSSLLIDTERAAQLIGVDITGMGSVIKEGIQSLTLGGNNSFMGSLTIREGDLIGDASSLANPGAGAIDLAPAAGDTARLIFDQNSNATLDGADRAITHSSGTGTVVLSKTGTGNLSFIGTSTELSIAPTVDIRVQQGELFLGPSRAAESRSYVIDSGATLRFRETAPTIGTVAGAVTGSGTLGAEFSTTSFTGDLAGFTGTLVSTGLRVVEIAPAVAPTSALSFDIQSDALSLILNDVHGFTFSGNLSGTSTLEKAGAAATRLTGATSHTGGTFVLAGELIGNTTNLQGAITVTDGAALRFDQATNGTFAGTISSSAGGGTGSVFKSGAGTLTLTQDIAARVNFAVEAGSLTFGPGVDFTSAMSSLVIGTGTPGARKSVSITPNFSGVGADNEVQVGGTLTFRSDSRFFTRLDANSGTATRFNAGGLIDIDAGAILDVTLEPGSYPNGITFDVLNGAGFADGDDFTIQEDLFFLDIAGAQVGNTYRLTLTQNGALLAPLASNPNQRTIGLALDNLVSAGASGDPELQRILDSLATIQGADVSTTLEEASADDLAALTNVRLANSARTWRGLSKRLAMHRDQAIGHHNSLESRRERARRTRLERRQRERERLRRGGRRPPVDAGPSGHISDARSPLSRRTPKPWVAWFEGSGAIGEIDSSDAQKYDYHLVGPILGADTALTPTIRAGFAVAGTHFAYDVSGRSNKGVANSAEGTVYGAYLGNPVEALLGFRYAHSWIDTDRIIQFGGIQDRVESDYEGDEYGLYAEFTRGFRFSGSGSTGTPRERCLHACRVGRHRRERPKRPAYEHRRRWSRLSAHLAGDPDRCRSRNRGGLRLPAATESALESRMGRHRTQRSRPLRGGRRNAATRGRGSPTRLTPRSRPAGRSATPRTPTSSSTGMDVSAKTSSRTRSRSDCESRGRSGWVGAIGMSRAESCARHTSRDAVARPARLARRPPRHFDRVGVLSTAQDRPRALPRVLAPANDFHTAHENVLDPAGFGVESACPGR